MNDHLDGLTERDLEILDLIHKKGPVTKNDLIGQLNLKLTTLNRSMKLLENKKLIVESGISTSTGGRKPAEYDVVQEGIYTIGVDISRTYVQIVVMTLKLRVLKKYRFEMDDEMTPQKCIDWISDAIKLITAQLSIQYEMLLGLGIGTVGPMDRENGILLHPQGFPNSAWEDDVPLKGLLQEATGLPCEIDNGANTAVLSEYLFGSGRDHQSVAYIHCGVGIRSAVIRDGMVIRTMNDSEDAFAHMTIDINGVACRCGSKGCLENYVSLEAILSQFCSMTGEDVGYKELFARAAGGDETAISIFKKSACVLGVGISNLSKLMNPDLIILSGPLVSNYEPYYSACISSFREQNSKISGPVFSKEGLFKEDVVSIGAGLMVLEQHFNLKGR